MATVWSPAPYITKQEWLLADGSIVTTPDFEATSSGRRIRVAGTTESFGSKQAEHLTRNAMDLIATERGTTKVMRLFTDQENDGTAASVAGLSNTVFDQACTLHLLGENHNRNGVTTAVWKFKAPNEPVFAYVFLSLVQRHDNYTIQPRLVFRNMLPDNSALNSYFTYEESAGASSDQNYRYSSEAQEVTRLVINHFLPLVGTFRNESYSGQMRTAVVKFAEMCKKIDTLDGVVVPNLHRGITAPTLVTLKPQSTNFSGSFYSELLAFVQTGPILDRIKANYKALMLDFKTLGLVVTAESDDTALAQALNGDATAIKCSLHPNEDTDVKAGGHDPYHTVSFDLATGTVVVNCSNQQSLNEVSEAWEIAKFKAEMLGEEDVLLEYAKAYQNPKEQRRLLKIINQRSIPDEG